jgi:hypothetical protein
VPPPLSAEPEEVPPSPSAEPAEVPPPLLADVKPPPSNEVKPPLPKVALQLVAVVRSPPLNADEATWLVNLFRECNNPGI